MKVLSYGLLVLAALSCFSLFLFYNYKYPIATTNPPRQDVYACDFKSKMNEAECVLRGINPFDVWAQNVQLPDFYPNSKMELWSVKRNKCVNSHPPWEYMLLMPFKFLPLRQSWILYSFLQAVSLLGIGILAFNVGRSLSGKCSDGAFVAACALMIPFGASLDFRAGNLCLYITIATIGMAVALNARHDVMAGFLWVIAMLKPQMGLFLAVPILLGRRLRPLMVAPIICIALSIPVSLLCDCSLLDMILQPPKSSSFWFLGCGLLPSNLLDALLRSGIDRSMLLTASTLVGFSLCVLLTLAINECQDWFVRFMPAAICALTCTYVNGYNFCFCSVIQIALAICVLKCPKRKSILVPIGLCAFFCLRVYDLFYFVIEQAYGMLSRSGIWRWGHISEGTNLSFTTWMSTGLLLCGIWACLTIAKHTKEL